MSAEQNCLKCGALLPDADEGICPSCGTPFGKATMAMKVDQSQLAEIAARRSAERQAAAAPVPQMAQNSAPQASSGPPMGLLIGIGVVVVVALVVVLLVVM